MARKITIDVLNKEIARLDPKLKPTDDYFKSAQILLSALQVGTTVKAIAKFTGLPREFVALRVGNLKRNNVFGPKGIIRADWFEKNGGIALWLDVAVAEGLMNRGNE